MSRRARDLLEIFVPALLSGGEVPVATPVGEETRQGLIARISIGRVPPELGRLRTAVVARDFDVETPLPLTVADADLIVAAWNLVALDHPALRRPDHSPGARRRAERYTLSRVAGLRWPGTASEALGNHALVDPLFRAERQDTQVRFWAGRLEFQGVPVPARVTRWEGLRQVERRHREVPIQETFSRELQPRLLEGLLHISPLTDLLYAHRQTPSFTFGPSARYLADPAICRGLVYRWAESPDPMAVGAALTRASIVRWAGAASPVEARLLADTLYYLHLVTNLQALVREEPEPVAGGPGLTAEGPHARQYAALFVLLHRDRRRWGLPDNETLGEALAERMGRYQRALEALNLDPELEALEAVLQERKALALPAAVGHSTPDLG